MKINNKNARDVADQVWTGSPSVTVDNNSGQSGITYRYLADIEAKPIDWLWPQMIALGKLTIIAGNPGLGKSQITARMAATVTTGGHWPANNGRSPKGKVVFLSSEDDAADTLRPRLDAAGADVGKVLILDSVHTVGENNKSLSRSLCLEKDVERIDQLLSELKDVALVIVDPITAYMGGADSHKTADVRGVLKPLAEMAMRHNVAVVCISHLNKSGGNEAMMRVSGSLAFVAAARAAFYVGADVEQSSRRLFLPIKNNIGNDRTGLAFNIETVTLASGIETSCIVWEDTVVQQTANDVLAESQTSGSKEEKSALQEAIDFLRDVLAEAPVSAKEIYKQASDAGISIRTVKRAKKDLGIKPQKKSMQDGWVWELPTKKTNYDEGYHT